MKIDVCFAQTRKTKNYNLKVSVKETTDTVELTLIIRYFNSVPFPTVFQKPETGLIH